jgi:hypothetical protein
VQEAERIAGSQRTGLFGVDYVVRNGGNFDGVLGGRTERVEGTNRGHDFS